MSDEMTWEEAISLADKKDKQDNCFAAFHNREVVDEEKSEEAGKTIYKNVPYVTIMAPGNDKEIVDRAAMEKDKERFPKEWYKFTHNDEEVELDGTPLSQWPQVNRAQVATLKANHMHTVEALAGAPDQNLTGMGVMDLKSKAVTFLEMQAGEATVQKLAAKNRRRDAKVKRLEKKIAGLEALLERKEQEQE